MQCRRGVGEGWSTTEMDRCAGVVRRACVSVSSTVAGVTIVVCVVPATGIDTLARRDALPIYTLYPTVTVVVWPAAKA